MRHSYSCNLITLTNIQVCAFDPEGLVFSVGVQSEHVKLYDLRGFDKGPFVTFKLPQEKQCEWTGKITVKHNKINETLHPKNPKNILVY